MSKSIKLQDDTFWDSMGIVHNKQLLSEELKIINNNINNLNNRTRDIKYYRQGWGASLTFETQNSGHTIIIAGGISHVIVLFNPLGNLFKLDLHKNEEYTLTRDENNFQKITITFPTNRVITVLSL